MPELLLEVAVKVHNQLYLHIEIGLHNVWISRMTKNFARFWQLLSTVLAYVNNDLRIREEHFQTGALPRIQ